MRLARAEVLPVKLSRYERALLSAGLASEDDLQSARERQCGAHRPLIEVLVEQEVASESDLVSLLGEVTGIPVLAAEDLLVDPSVQDLVPAEMAQRHGILPLRREGEDRLLVATTDPFQLPVFDALRAKTELKIRRVLAAPSHLRRAMREARPDGEAELDTLLRRVPTVTERFKVVPAEDAVPANSTADDADEGPAVRLVKFMLSDAITKGVSDIHIEAEKDALRVRFRLDGELRDVLSLPAALHASVIKRLKIVTGLNTIESRRPQDGRAKISCATHDVDLRISTIPSYFGEKAVIRLLDQGAACFHLDRSGLDRALLVQWRELLRQPHGLLLVTGPTGSGKTSTLYASILELRDPAINIVTVEDPVEYQFPGIVHVPVHSETGMTFAAGLRSILRQDPDVVLLGEIRDRETAEVALRAAVTGHLVLSTLHTNDAIGSIARLVDLGVSRKLLASALLGVMSQRLVRTICPGCSEPCNYPPGALRALNPGSIRMREHDPRFGRGCAACFGTGLRGRSAIAELVINSRTFKSILASGGDEDELRAQADADGSLPLSTSGVRKVLSGECTPAEVLKVVVAEGSRQAHTRQRTCPGCGEALDEAWRLCPACGEDAAPPAPAPASEWPCCCGQTVKASWCLCPFCGVKTQAPTPPTPDAEAERRPTVLVCDDNEVVRARLRAILGSTFGEILEAEDGRVALDQISRRMPSLLIVDQDMPVLTGVEVIRRLRSSLETALLPIVMLTGCEGEALEEMALEAGADDYMTKPVKPARLLSRLRALLASHERSLQRAA